MRRHFNVDLTNERSFWTLWAEEFRRLRLDGGRLGYVPWLKVGKISTHLVSTAFFCPRLYGSVVRVEQHEVVLFFRSLTNVLRCLFTKRRGSRGQTHDAISHQVTAWCHPGCHLGSLHKRTKLRVFEHEIGGHDRAIRSVTRRRGPVVETRDGLLQRALDAVRADDEIGI